MGRRGGGGEEEMMMRRNLQDPDPGSQGDAELLQPFLGKVGQLQHSYLRFLKDTRVLLVTEVLQQGQDLLRNGKRICFGADD